MTWIALMLLACAGTDAAPAETGAGNASDTGTAGDTATDTLSPLTTCDDVTPGDWTRDAAAKFESLDERRAVFHGVIRASTPGRFDTFFANHPDLEQLVMPYGPGSANDDAMLELAYAVRDAGVSTCVPAGGMIASGAVDLFIAGTTRFIGPDAMVGVHSWGGGGIVATELPEDHAAHQPYIAYYTAMGLNDPSGFYFFTLNAAPASGIHYMTESELQTWGLPKSTAE